MWQPVDAFQSKATVTLSKLLCLNIAVPELQRDVSQERVDDIVGFQMHSLETTGSFCFLGDLMLWETADNVYLLIDGMHRYEAMKQVYMHMPNYQVSLTKLSNIDIKDAFTLLNKAEPVPEYIMDSVYDLGRRAFLETFSSLFQKEFKHFISKNKSPNRPNVSLSTVLDQLSNSTIWLEAPALANPSYLFKCFMFVNTNYLSKLDTKGTNNSRILNKAQSKNCMPLYLTNDTDHTWTMLLLRAHSELLEAKASALHNANNASNKNSKSLPKAIRVATWRHWFKDAPNALCFICKSGIDTNHFECGHIVSRYNGGTDNITNLRPICSLCNKSMGKQNMNEFCKHYGVKM